MRISDWSSDVCSSDLIARHLVEEVRLHRQDHQVLRAGLCGGTHGLHLGDMLAAVLPDQLQAALLDRRQVRALVDDGDVVAGALIAGLRKLCRHQAADRAGAYHAAPHGRRPPRSEEQTSDLQSLMRTSYAVFCL